MTRACGYSVFAVAVLTQSLVFAQPPRAPDPDPVTAEALGYRSYAEAEGAARAGEKLRAVGLYREAASRFLEAFQAQEEGRLLFMAARSLARAGESDAAERAYSEYSLLRPADFDFLREAIDFQASRKVQRQELTARAAAAERAKAATQQQQWQLELKQASPPVTKRRPAAWAWASGGVGLALVGTGLGLRIHASGLRQDVLDAQSQAVDGQVPRDALTQREAASKDATSKRSQVWGAVTLGVGAAALASGVLGLVFTRGRRATSSSTHVSAVPTRGGAAVALDGRF